MSQVKRAAAKALADTIETQIPELAGRVFPSWADEENEAAYPAVVVLPGRMKFEPWQEDEIDDSDPNVLVLSVGDFEGEAELRVYAKSEAERERIGQLVTDLFMAREGAPGVLVADTDPIPLNVLGSRTPQLGTAHAAFTLDDDEWSEERVFSKKRYQFMNVGVVFPCLVARSVPTILQLVIEMQAAVALDLTQPAPTDPNDPSLEKTDPETV